MKGCHRPGRDGWDPERFHNTQPSHLLVSRSRHENPWTGPGTLATQIDGTNLFANFLCEQLCNSWCMRRYTAASIASICIHTGLSYISAPKTVFHSFIEFPFRRIKGHRTSLHTKDHPANLRNPTPRFLRPSIERSNLLPVNHCTTSCWGKKKLKGTVPRKEKLLPRTNLCAATQNVKKTWASDNHFFRSFLRIFRA